MGGFVPLGCFFCAFLAVIGAPRPVLVAVILGMLISLTIEVLQAYIPTRDSGMTDITTNTLGTAIGAALFQHEAIKNVFARSLDLIEKLALRVLNLKKNPFSS